MSHVIGIEAVGIEAAGNASTAAANAPRMSHVTHIIES